MRNTVGSMLLAFQSYIKLVFLIEYKNCVYKKMFSVYVYHLTPYCKSAKTKGASHYAS